MPTETDKISNCDDLIDSRAIEARITEIQELICDDTAESDGERLEPESFEDEREELRLLTALSRQGEGFSDWENGETLIRDSYFKDYAMQLADDIGAVPNDAAWPCTCIDWDRAARELKMDYSSIEFGDVTYWIRS